MNKLVDFNLCTLTDDELLKKVDKQTDNLYKSGKVPARNVPARPNEDFDLLVGELIKRFANRLGKPVMQKIAEENLPTWEECDLKIHTTNHPLSQPEKFIFEEEPREKHSAIKFRKGLVELLNSYSNSRLI